MAVDLADMLFWYHPKKIWSLMRNLVQVQDLNRRVNVIVRQVFFKYSLMDTDLYCRTVGDIIPEHLEDQARVAVGKVYTQGKQA